MSSVLVIPAEGRWSGIDGRWSTFAISVGTPGQSFRILPRTMGEGVWVPTVGCCTGYLESIKDCGLKRGIKANASLDVGFKYDSSQTWDQIGTYGLEPARHLSNAQGFYGLDTVSVKPGSPIPAQIVAGIMDEELWLGSLGLGPSSSSFSGLKEQPSLIRSLKSLNMTPSLSYGYTAGRPYIDPPELGSLVLGGFDSARLSSSTITAPITRGAALNIVLDSIVVTNTPNAIAQGLLPNRITVSLDSTVSQLWLPGDTCDYFAQAFGLSYDAATQLYFVDESVQSLLRANATKLTFTLTTDLGRTNIVMGYNAFNMSVSPPLVNSSRPYFPLRRAKNSTQITLGRAFLQEAYLIVDWERANFTIGQLVSGTSDITMIMPLPETEKPDDDPTASQSHPSKPTAQTTSGTPPPGAIAAIVLTLVLMLVLLSLAAYWYCHRKKQPAQADVIPDRATSDCDGVQSVLSKKPNQLGDALERDHDTASVHELEVGYIGDLCASKSNARDELMSAPVLELETPIGELAGPNFAFELYSIPEGSLEDVA